MKINSKKSGFSLTEVMIAVFVFSIVALGVASATMLTNRIAITNIYSSTAKAVAQGYAEQIKTIDYDAVFNAFSDPTNNSIPTVGLSLTSTDSSGEMQVDDPLIFGVQTEKQILIDVEMVEVDGKQVEKPKTMSLWVTPVGYDLATETNCWDALEIRLEYEWELAGETYRDYIQIVKTKVSEY